MSHKTGNSGLSGVSGFSGKPEPAESAVPCSLLRQGLKFARGGAVTNHRSHHYLAKAPAFASGTGELITRRSQRMILRDRLKLGAGQVRTTLIFPL